MTTHSEREAFEAWASSKGWPIDRIEDAADDEMQYEDTAVSLAWMGLQALTPHPTEVGEAAAWQVRCYSHASGRWYGWQKADKETFDSVMATGRHYDNKAEVRELFTHPAPAAVDGEYQQALEEAAMLTEAVTITGRTPKELLNDIICYHIANSAEGKVMPVDPTEAMLEAGTNAHYEADDEMHRELMDDEAMAKNTAPDSMRWRKNRAAHVYKAMLNATASTSRGS